MSVDHKEKIVHATRHYDSPEEVLGDESLSEEEKKRVLKSMSLDAKLESVATAEGMAEDTGTHSLKEIKSALLAIDEELADDATTKVGNANQFPYRRILVALETGDTLVDEILSTAVEFSHEANSSIRFLTVVSHVPEEVSDIALLPAVDPNIPLDHREKIAKAEVAKAKSAGRHLLDSFEPLGESKHVVRRGVLEDEIIKYATQWPADLLVMGAHNRSWFKKILSNPSSTRVLDGVGCAVLIVPEASSRNQ
ncbi:universal stress protein [Leisingera sp. JC1]|uniref:universal stress protein n=1 Tax=Leisingera sp. JC1 TaxID=1855282 RepID=UPI0015866714|nr:universal stress protein [Leisingera sp. JC1]